MGYFRSSLFVLVGLAFSDFARREGRARIICSPYLLAEDIEAIERGLSLRDVQEESIVADIRAALESPRNRPVVEFLATLVAAQVLEIRLATRPGTGGLFHDKVGIFTDQSGNQVSFIGSANETFSAWDPESNHEAFEVFSSWLGEGDHERVMRHAAYFNALWEGREPGLVTSPFGSMVLEELAKLKNPEGIDAAAESVRLIVDGGGSRAGRVSEPQIRRTLLAGYQREAVDNWFANGHRGILAHVTGAGKTLTAIEIIRRWISDQRPAIVFVPSEILLEQWRTHLDRDLHDLPVALLGAGGGHERNVWKRFLPDHTRPEVDFGPRVTLATIQTGRSPDFLARVCQGSHLLVVADEVHRLGSPSCRRILDLQAGGRLGLSATPTRFGDEDGSAAIAAYFGRVLKPPFEIRDAIRAGRLVPYDYYVHRVELSSDEQAAWDELTESIGREYAKLPGDGTGGKRHTEAFRLLLIRRSRILKQAAGKSGLARSVLREHYQDGDRWLVYCDSQSQLGEVVETIRALGMPVNEYHSGMSGSRSETLDYFEERGGVLVAIRCLDEGVDIPMVNRALILASSTNSREFIQRRGRVLRVSQGKYSASIHDALVFPCGRTPGDGIDRMSIVETELRRALEFAKDARNASVRHQIGMWIRDARRSAGQRPAEEFEEETDE